ncbi:L-2-hydroxyglutarate oxidase [Malonomonas rubra]|uniref:L-2-hydroxyglutarate oxidase n=1 Tax=Malonomonas rubra TaxID=57040 RepID=UPI000933237D
MKSDLVVVGNGIVGAATALRIKQDFPHLSVLMIDKEQSCATHQTGHNSGVVHAGVYYQPGSLKADFCKRGAMLTKSFCLQNNIPFVQCGKLLVATNELELTRMEALAQRCHENGITTVALSEQELKAKESKVSGLGALHVPATAITDFPKITETMVAHFCALGGQNLFGAEITQIKEDGQSVRINTGQHLVETSALVVCAGLMADRLVRMMGVACDFQIIPFRGEYYRLAADLNDVVKHLIYPIPDPDLPFLGVHLTPMVNGTVTVGPNAVLGWKREGYSTVNFNIKDVAEMLSFPGFWKVLQNNFATGLKEMSDSLLLSGYLKRVQKYCPSIKATDLKPYPAGIRAQAVLSDGSLVHDFLFKETERSLHVCNAPSPAATSAMPIGEYLAAKAAEKFRL